MFLNVFASQKPINPIKTLPAIVIKIRLLVLETEAVLQKCNGLSHDGAKRKNVKLNSSSRLRLPETSSKVKLQVKDMQIGQEFLPQIALVSPANP